MSETRPGVKHFYTTAEVAQRYGTVAGTVRYWRHTGYGPRGLKIGRRVLYPHDEIVRWETEQRQAQAA